MSKYYVIDNQKLTPSTLLLTLRVGPRSKALVFKPGQYAVISFKQNGRPTPARCFSIVNAPSSHGIIQCSIRKKGRFTNAAMGLAEGDVVNVTGPFGGFVFNERRDRNMVLIAGGIGITPFMSMIQYATNNKLTNEITLIYSCNDQNDVPFVEQLIDIEKRNPYFKIIFAISSGPTNRFANYDVVKGRITSEVISDAVNETFGDKTFFVCGPIAFMNAMTDILYENGVSEDRVMTEAFGHGPSSKKTKTQNWPRKVYMFGAVGLALSMVTVMISDLIKSLPSSASSSPSTVTTPSSTNSRQDDLDNLINGSGDDSGSNSNSGTTNNSTTTTPAATTTTNSTSTPKCTTTQSGTTTCV
jgi:ferredoxin-NADP reductase